MLYLYVGLALQFGPSLCISSIAAVWCAAVLGGGASSSPNASMLSEQPATHFICPL